MYRRRNAALIQLGVDHGLACTTAWRAKGPWRISYTLGVRIALHNHYFDALGLQHLDSHGNV